MSALITTAKPSHGEPGKPVRLRKGALHSIRLGALSAVKIRITQGLCWVSMEGDRNDYVAGPNCELRFTGPGLLVLEGMQEQNAAEVSSGAP